jgi:NADP-dependent 3-hydroxy acid dehydrogenase YdfG
LVSNGISSFRKLKYMPTALITGAGGGIGSAIASALSATHTLLLAGRPSDRLDGVAERLGATTFPLDLTNTDEIEAACEIVDELDVLVHTAGVSIPGHVAESNVDEWRATFAVNLFGTVELTLALLPALRSARGQVVFINSGAGRNALPAMASYSASKFALRAFADSLRDGEPDLRVTTIYPGRTDSAMQRELVAFEGGEYDPANFLRPETVAAAVAYAVATPPDGHVHEVVLRPRRRD